MRVFVTGASGWIGSAVVPELLAAGHEVLGLARSDASAEAVARAGATPHRGSLDDLESLRSGAAASDGVVHLGFKHDFSDMAGAGRTERAAVETMAGELEGSGRPFLFAAGVAMLAPGRIATEEDPTPMVGPDAMRGGGEALALSYAERGLRPVALRFAPSVHGTRDHGFIATLVDVARRQGRSAWVGDGANRWAAVHRTDAARLVRLALEREDAGPVVHAVAEEAIPTREIAEAIGKAVGVPSGPVTLPEVTDHFGWIGAFFGMDLAASSRLTQERLGWTPTGPGLLDDLAAGAYTSA
ncbi:nucleoside-diphosphate-sugar epimerase [Motilibacter rhizosphaerae]|uniref:Nucleoside-diphosphate-sugar epimerase n=1 Tax=Motilibacter rhizosphaerae TaxID=598652 RepID=A0A4Q7NV27_9ACTN|nr:SDR family oxidoreductase [Motilibacter rhizosphaerae]RZS91096.1 nucleoside-diphosphate-sugar epimerase [Motilibacter rhizosphaerae]